MKGNQYDLFAKNASELFHEIIAPLKIPENVNKLIIIPDGKLFYIPFDVLLTSNVNYKISSYKSLPYLLYRYAIHYQVSATLMFETRRNSNLPIRADRFAAFAPVHVDEAYDIPDLFGSEREALGAAGIMNGNSFIKNQATETVFRKEIENYSILHLATHAVVDDISPLQSKLLFYPSNDTLNDGILHNYEIYNMKIPATLVALSACNTGIGKLENGEGVISLARSFIYAGTTSILMVLWPASDKATETISKNFYEELARGENKDEALRQAKLNYLETSDEISADPFLWSSFVLIGDSNPVIKTNTVLWITLTVLILVCMSYVIVKKLKMRSITRYN